MGKKTLSESREGIKIEDKPKVVDVSTSVGQVISVTDRPDGKKEILIIVEGDYKLNEIYKIVK